MYIFSATMFWVLLENFA